MNVQHASQAALTRTTPARSSLLQRACACGQHAEGGECEACRRKREVTLQRAAISADAGGAVAPPIVHEVLNSPGQPLDTTTRADLEPRFGHNFSRVRVHTDDRSAQSAQSVNALAYTVGNHVAFDTGQYRLGSSDGRRLLAHELAHVVQQIGTTSLGGDLPVASSRDATEIEAVDVADSWDTSHEGASIQHRSVLTVQRRERPNTDKLDPDKDLGDWTVNDRVNETARWQRANFYNLIHQRPHEYTQPHERRDFYLWFYTYTSMLGFETRWPLAAYLVASGASRLSYGVPFENNVQVVARQGNQIIFDAVFPELKKLLMGPPLKGPAAQAWDAQVLSDEQTLVESMYKTTPAKTVDAFGAYARQEGVLATTGVAAGFSGPHRPGKYHREGDMPAFSGDIRSVEDRYAYGMRVADQFSTHPAPPAPGTRPAAGAPYASGAEFTKLNTRLGLHRLDAELDDFDVDEGRVIDIVQGLSAEEQAELGFNAKRLDFLRSALDKEEMERALRGRTHIPISTRSYLLQ